MRPIRITNIQRFCIHDGPGIRTTVFLKGCGLHCPWCCNPENIHYEFQAFRNSHGEQGTYGKDISSSELVNEIKKDSIYFKTSNGGATFSGGEPLLHIAELQPVLDELGACGIHRAVETSLFVTGQLLSQALNLIDLFIVDVKILDENLCYNVIGGQLNTYLSNVNVLDRAGIPYWLRFPAIPGLTYDKENIEAVRNFIERHHPEKVQILPAHNLGASKYESLGNIPPRLTTPDLSVLKDVWRGSTFPYEVLSL